MLNRATRRALPSAAVAVATVLAPTTVVSANPESTSAWDWTEMSKVVKGKRESRGLALYTTAEKSLGAAFRCDDSRLFAFVSVMPVDMQEIVTGSTRRPKNWDVRLSINGGAEREERWVSMFGGKIFMATSAETAAELFHAARDGAEIEFVRPYGKPVSIRIPADSDGIFAEFELGCELET